MREGGFSIVEVLIATALLGAMYALLHAGIERRFRPLEFSASTVQARLWADAAEVARLGGGLAPGSADAAAVLRGVAGAAPAATPFGGAYRVEATEHTAVVSFDVPFEARGGGIFSANRDGEGGVVRLAPSVFAPTAAMRDKALLYRETPR